MAELRERIAKLQADGATEEAAALCHAQGLFQQAADLYEEACAFHLAAESAARIDLPRAVRLAVLSGRQELFDDMSEQLLAQGTQPARNCAAELRSRGFYRHAAALYDALGDAAQAAAAFERAGAIRQAALSYDEAGDPASAARLLEAALRGSHDEDSDSLRLTLAEIYGRHGKHKAVTRVLQQLAQGTPERDAGLPLLAQALGAQGYDEARRVIEREMQERGIQQEDPPDAPADAATEATVLYRRYAVLREVAVTPHARLLHARDPLADRDVAIKIFAAQASSGSGRDALQRFEREARALTELRHPNVVPLFDMIARGPAMVLAWMPGGDLRTLIDAGSVSPARAAEIVRALLSALAAAHRMGIVHRDIKPSNVLFDDGGTARLADFGAAHMGASGATVTVGEIGTLHYMAPEQRQGQAASVQSDLYSLGVLLFEMLAGRRPRSLDDERSIAWSHPDLTAEHDALSTRLLAADPADRFASALDARAALDACHWPSRVVPRTAAAEVTVAPAPAGPADDEARLVLSEERDANGLTVAQDAWLGRKIAILPLTDANLARASAFARAGHPALASVLRVDTATKQIWIEQPPGARLPLASLTPDHVTRLREALAALHRRSTGYGPLDQRVYADGPNVFLAYSVEPGADVDTDLHQLDALLLF